MSIAQVQELETVIRQMFPHWNIEVRDDFRESVFRVVCLDCQALGLG